MSTAEDRARLREFLLTLRDDLGFVVERHEAILPGYDDAFEGSIEDAWESVEGEFEAIAADIENGLDESLIENGLTGDQLAFKLGVIEGYQEGFDVIRERWDDIVDLADPVRTTLVGPITKSYLGVVEGIVKSILNAVGAGDAPDEIKDLIERILPI